MTVRAFFAIVEARLHAQRRAAIATCVAAAVVGLIAPRGIEGPLFFGSLLGIVVALLQGPGRHVHLDWCEQSAPLFGRELARAKAFVPCAIALLATFAYCVAGVAMAGPSGFMLRFGVASIAVVACTLTALSATTRTWAPRWLYITLAALASVTAYAFITLADTLPGAVAFCALVSILALRQYGETLARYDPVV
ncbi:MAG: hypothetical protein JO199_04885 [Candidatus Eremiobacteraeota bacterium]|nr:hypothetical protein [Candidatus Eremiobacteraeota bacterium]